MNRKGRPNLMTTDQLVVLKDWIVSECRANKSKTASKIALQAAHMIHPTIEDRDVLKLNEPSRQWVLNLVKSDEELQGRMAEELEDSRINNCTITYVKYWHYKIIENFNVAKCFNFNVDETMLSSNDSTTYVYGPRDKQKFIIESTPNLFPLHVTMGLCICSDGTSIMPFVVYSGQSLPADCSAYEHKFSWFYNKSGWVTKEIFERWVIEIFIPSVNLKRAMLNLPLDTPCILWSDNHTSRLSIPALKALSESHITLLTFISHTSHCLQPLDRVVNTVFKSKLRGYLKTKDLKAPLNERRPSILEAVDHALYDSLYEGNIKKSFKISGIFHLI